MYRRQGSWRENVKWNWNLRNNRLFAIGDISIGVAGPLGSPWLRLCVEWQIYINQMSEVDTFWTFFFLISEWGFSYVTQDKIPDFSTSNLMNFWVLCSLNNGVCKFSLVEDLVEKNFLTM